MLSIKGNGTTSVLMDSINQKPRFTTDKQIDDICRSSGFEIELVHIMRSLWIERLAQYILHLKSPSYSIMFKL